MARVQFDVVPPNHPSQSASDRCLSCSWRTIENCCAVRVICDWLSVRIYGFFRSFRGISLDESRSMNFLSTASEFQVLVLSSSLACEISGVGKVDLKIVGRAESAASRDQTLPAVAGIGRKEIRSPSPNSQIQVCQFGVRRTTRGFLVLGWQRMVFGWRERTARVQQSLAVCFQRRPRKLSARFESPA